MRCGDEGEEARSNRSQDEREERAGQREFVRFLPRAAHQWEQMMFSQGRWLCFSFFNRFAGTRSPSRSSSIVSCSARRSLILPALFLICPPTPLSLPRSHCYHAVATLSTSTAISCVRVQSSLMNVRGKQPQIQPWHGVKCDL